MYNTVFPVQLMSEIAEATEQLRGHRAALESADVGRDEASVHALATQLDARRRLLAAQQRALQPLQHQATALAQVSAESHIKTISHLSE